MKNDGAKQKKVPKFSRLHKPEGMSFEQWQLELRRQFGREQAFNWRRNDDDPNTLHEYTVDNPVTKRSYHVIIRGRDPGRNYCSCPDFAVNTLGTCKHVEFVISQIEKKRDGKRLLSNSIQESFSEVILKYGAQRRIQFLAGSDCPHALKTRAGLFFDNTGTMTEKGFDNFEEFLKASAGLDHLVKCREEAIDFIAEKRDESRRNAHLGNIFGKGSTGDYFKKLLKTELFPYQKDGAIFAVMAGRCLIGDEMGLGKTIQALAAVEILARESGLGQALIVCPTLLKHQWASEIARFCGRPVKIVEGSTPDPVPDTFEGQAHLKTPIMIPGTPYYRLRNGLIYLTPSTLTPAGPSSDRIFSTP